jgi:hypothetical protein
MLAREPEFEAFIKTVHVGVSSHFRSESALLCRLAPRRQEGLSEPPVNGAEAEQESARIVWNEKNRTNCSTAPVPLSMASMSAPLIEMHHVLVRVELFGISLDAPRRKLLTSVFNVVAIDREIAWSRCATSSFCGTCSPARRATDYERRRCRRFELTELDRSFLALAKTSKQHPSS